MSNIALINETSELNESAISVYSTIMDLITLNKKAFFIPTPGQTEQEYLANRFLKNKIFYMQKQSEYNLDRGLKEMKKYNVQLSMNQEEKNWEELFSLF